MKLDDIERAVVEFGPDVAALLPLADLRRRRQELQAFEGQVSLARRILHSRLDLTGTVVKARRAGEQDPERQLALVLEELPRLLTDDPYDGPASPPARRGFVDPDEELLAELDALGGSDAVDLVDADDAELVEVLHDLRDAERRASALRLRLHRVLDVLTGEIGRRYRHAEVEPAGLSPRIEG
jgi:RsiG-like